MKKIIALLLLLLLYNCKKAEAEVEKENQPTEKVEKTAPQTLENQTSIRPEKTIIRNLTIDTATVFGIWTQEKDSPHAEFQLTSKSFYIVDYDGNGDRIYILDKNEITLFYENEIQKGIITTTKKDTLKIKWGDSETETTYIKFEN
ncbi:hypothetical protein [Flavobacterium sp.]|uniref:hypothetical protein n=1 Tax=Flavobacterium sp. TaxID=239 RepID=UPI004048720E